MTMELVCKETRRPFVWFYDNNISTYIRKSGNEINGSIRGANIPDPLSIMESRMRAKQKGQIPMDARIEADPVTKQLWRHYHANFNT